MEQIQLRAMVVTEKPEPHFRLQAHQNFMDPVAAAVVTTVTVESLAPVQETAAVLAELVALQELRTQVQAAAEVQQEVDLEARVVLA